MLIVYAASLLMALTTYGFMYNRRQGIGVRLATIKREKDKDDPDERRTIARDNLLAWLTTVANTAFKAHAEPADNASIDMVLFPSHSLITTLTFVFQFQES